MIVYNVTCNVENPMASEWLEWMKTVHIPEVMATGCFVENKILKFAFAQSNDTIIFKSYGRETKVHPHKIHTLYKE